MFFTRHLQISNKRIFKRLLEKPVVKEVPFTAPVLQEKGIPIYDPRQKVDNTPEWKPPSDDPRFPAPDTKTTVVTDTNIFTYRTNTNLLEGTAQACLLTNTLMYEGMPSAVQKLIGQVEVPNEAELLQKAIMKSHIWDSTMEKLPKRTDSEKPTFKFPREYGIPKKKSAKMLLFDLVRIANTALLKSHPETFSNHHLLFTPKFCSHYQYRGMNINLQLSCEHMLTSTKLLEPYADEQQVEVTEFGKLPNMDPMLPTIDLTQEDSYIELTNQTGFREDSKTCPHTLFIINDNEWSEDQKQARALIMAMTHALSFAKMKYTNLKGKVPHPVVVQAVNMDSLTINFTYFQLNTTDFDGSEDQIKNMVWFDTGNKMFNKYLRQPWKKRIEFRHNKILDFHPEAFHKILATMMYSSENENDLQILI